MNEHNSRAQKRYYIHDETFARKEPRNYVSNGGLLPVQIGLGIHTEGVLARKLIENFNDGNIDGTSLDEHCEGNPELKDRLVRTIESGVEKASRRLAEVFPDARYLYQVLFSGSQKQAEYLQELNQEHYYNNTIDRRIIEALFNNQDVENFYDHPSYTTFKHFLPSINFNSQTGLVTSRFDFIAMRLKNPQFADDLLIEQFENLHAGLSQLIIGDRSWRRPLSHIQALNEEQRYLLQTPLEMMANDELEMATIEVRTHSNIVPPEINTVLPDDEREVVHSGTAMTSALSRMFPEYFTTYDMQRYHYTVPLYILHIFIPSVDYVEGWSYLSRNPLPNPNSTFTHLQRVEPGRIQATFHKVKNDLERRGNLRKQRRKRGLEDFGA